MHAAEVMGPNNSEIQALLQQAKLQYFYLTYKIAQLSLIVDAMLRRATTE
jgi:hypothetical protein